MLLNFRQACLELRIRGLDERRFLHDLPSKVHDQEKHNGEVGGEEVLEAPEPFDEDAVAIGEENDANAAQAYIVGPGCQAASIWQCCSVDPLDPQASVEAQVRP